MKNKKTLLYDDACPLCSWYSGAFEKTGLLYNFISYNRKVIVARKTAEGRIDCTPDFNIFYRLLFMAVFLAFNTILLFPVHAGLIARTDFFHISIYEFHAAHAVIVTINCLLALSLAKREAIEYLGQVNMLALITILLLLPLVAVNNWVLQSNSVNAVYLLLLTIFIVKEYFRRMDFAGIAKSHENIVAINLSSIAGFIACLFVL